MGIAKNGKSAGKQKLGFECLSPGGKYKILKETFTADAHGNASIEVDLNGRTALTLSLA